MVRSRTAPPHPTHSSLLSPHQDNAQYRRRCALIAAVIATVAAVAGAHSYTYKRFNPEPYHTSSLSGADWVKELENGHSDRMLHNLGVRVHVFKKLINELQREGNLQPRRHVTVDEMVATFLFQSSTNLSVPVSAKLLKGFREVLKLFLGVFV